MHRPRIRLVSRIISENAASNGCQSDIAQKTADNQRIRDIIELLKQVARNQRQAETDQPGADGALS